MSNRERARLCLPVVRQFGTPKMKIFFGCFARPMQVGIKSSIICLAEFSQAVHTHPVPLCTSDQGDLVFVPKIYVCMFQVWKSKEAN